MFAVGGSTGTASVGGVESERVLPASVPPCSHSPCPAPARPSCVLSEPCLEQTVSLCLSGPLVALARLLCLPGSRGGIVVLSRLQPAPNGRTIEGSRAHCLAGQFPCPPQHQSPGMAL